MSSSVKIRLATEDDMALIVNSWLETYWGSDVGRALNRLGREPALRPYLQIIEYGQERPSFYYGLQRKLVTGLLARCGAIVACDPAAESVLYGWLCGDESEEVPLLHYVCVKEGFQDRGIAGKLLKEAGFRHNARARHTHTTGDFDDKINDGHWEYRPELARIG